MAYRSTPARVNVREVLPSFTQKCIQDIEVGQFDIQQAKCVTHMDPHIRKSPQSSPSENVRGDSC